MVVVQVVSAGVCSAHGALISGALAIRFGGIADRLVPPWFFGAGEWERRLRGFAGVNTLLGPEETDFEVGPLAAGLLSVWASCGTDHLSYRLVRGAPWVRPGWVLVAGLVWSLFVV